MKYYLEIESEEHMLNAYELAKLYNIRTLKDKPHSHFVARLVKEYKLAHKVDFNCYYRTSKGDMMMVIPSSIWRPLLDKLLEDFPHNTVCEMEFSNKSHYFVIKDEE